MTSVRTRFIVLFDNSIGNFISLAVAVVKETFVFERNHGDGFDAYPTSSFVVVGSRVTLVCNRTTEPSFQAIWLYRDSEATRQSEKNIPRAFNDREFNVSAQSLTIPRFESIYEGTYGCGRVQGGQILDSGFALLQLAGDRISSQYFPGFLTFLFRSCAKFYRVRRAYGKRFRFVDDSMRALVPSAADARLALARKRRDSARLDERDVR